MNVNKMIDKLTAYEMDGANPPDGRQVMRDMRMSLQVGIETMQRRRDLEAKLERINPTSRQGSMQYAAIQRELRATPEVNLAEAVEEAQDMLQSWMHWVE